MAGHFHVEDTEGPVLDEVNNMPIAVVAEVSVQGNGDVELNEEAGEGGEDEGEGEVGVCEAEEAEGICGSFSGKGDSVGFIVEGEDGAEVGEDLGIVEERVGEAAEKVDADAEGVDVVHAEVVRDHVGEDKAAKDEGEDSDADAGCGGKHPDQEYEGADTETEHGRNVDCGEHIVLLSMETLFRIGLAVESLIRIVNFKECGGAFRNPHLV